MNTQTHILLACVILAPTISTSRRAAMSVVDQSTAKPGTGLLIVSAILGALTPDASIFFMWGLSKWQGVPESVVWQEWYFSDHWQQLAALSNSIPIFIFLLIVSWIFGARISSSTHGTINAPVHLKIDTANVPAFLFVFSLAALIHAVTDLPLHHDDGRPHFWPFSHWVFRSPVSYWDPNHYGSIWSAIELLLAMLLIVILWRRYRHVYASLILSFIGLSYLVVTGYWWLAF